MIGREHEYYQYQEVMADSDGEAEEARQKQQELIDFVFSSKWNLSVAILGMINGSHDNFIARTTIALRMPRITFIFNNCIYRYLLMIYLQCQTWISANVDYL